MADDFKYDVFLSHSSKDTDVARDIAERLRGDGLRVWFEGWEVRADDNMPMKIEEGLERSRVLVLCISANAFGSEWAQLETGTFRFRDPLNKERRFIPLRLDAVPIKYSLAQFVYIDWLPQARELAYKKLLEVCRPAAKPDRWLVQAGQVSLGERVIRLGYKGIYSYAFSADGDHVLTSAKDGRVRLWDLRTSRCLMIFNGHESEVNSLAWSADQNYAFSGSDDKTVRLWDVRTGRCSRVFKGHSGQVWNVAWSADERLLLSSGSDKTIRLWDVKSGRCLRVFEGHVAGIWSIKWSADQQRILSGSIDKTIRLWDVDTGRCLRVLEGHTGSVRSVAWITYLRRVLSGSDDKSVRVWDLESGLCLGVLEGHRGTVESVIWSGDLRCVLSGGADRTVRVWDLGSGRCIYVLRGHGTKVESVAWNAAQRRIFSGDKNGGIWVWNLEESIKEIPNIDAPILDASTVPSQVQYTNAKVLLVGDSGVGKTGLANYLALGIKDEERNSSTDGAWATQWILPNTDKQNGLNREIWLWDFAGQVDYRLVHQLFMEDTAAAVLVFNPQNENPFEGLGQWDRDLQKAARKPFVKLLAAGRIDRGGLVVSRTSMDRFLKERGFLPPLHETSAKTGEGCDTLCEAILAAIDWQSIPETTSPALYHRMKQEILHLRDSGLVLIRLAELKQRMELALIGERFELAELETVVGLLAGPGMIQRLDFGGFILLRPEVLSRYAAAVVRKVRKHPQELGCIREDEMLVGELDYQDFERLPQEDETVVLRALHETFVSRAWCLRQPYGSTALLTFPSYFRRERPEQPNHPSILVTYRFTGPVDDIYATLVVRLHHAEAFETDQLWKFAADFKTQTGRGLGLKLAREPEGTARLEVYFTPDVEMDSRVVFLRYVHNHLTEQAREVVRLRHYACENKKCDSYSLPFTDQAKIDKALVPGGKGKVFCPDCGKPIQLLDVMEEKFHSPVVKEQARQMQEEVQLVIDNESRELILVGHAFSIAGEAGQIYRGYTNSDHGIDGEIEFKDNQGRATGKRLYLQLKSGDSYLTKRQRDSAEVFQIKNERWASYWQQQAYPVLLVIRNSKGEIRWMDVSDYLRRASDGGKKAVKQIVFEGERLDVMSVRRWRDKVLGRG